jgi:hypothetical protein
MEWPEVSLSFADNVVKNKMYFKEHQMILDELINTLIVSKGRWSSIRTIYLCIAIFHQAL